MRLKRLNYNTKYHLHQKVEVIELDLKGVILNIWIGDSGVQYKVRYFWNCKAEEIYFLENELKNL